MEVVNPGTDVLLSAVAFDRPEIRAGIDDAGRTPFSAAILR
jgi:hypothetical protein